MPSVQWCWRWPRTLPRLSRFDRRCRRLFAGIKEGKFGIEVITRNQDDALKMVAQHLGMVRNKTELSGPDGGPVKTESVNLKPKEVAEVYRKLME